MHDEILLRATERCPRIHFGMPIAPLETGLSEGFPTGRGEVIIYCAVVLPRAAMNFSTDVVDPKPP